MKIPKCLAGKKAEKFEDWLQFRRHDTFTELSRLASYRKLWKEEIQVLAFYRTPFTPNMIEELFEGWEKKNDWLYVYKHPDKPVRQISIEVNGEIWMNSMQVNPRPQTLSDFISACNNSGIELKFKESE
jgi:hypothetical protein